LEHLGVSAHQPPETRNFQKSRGVGHHKPGIHTSTLTDELREGDEVFKQEPSYEQLKKRKSSKI
jgi:hypothetical protein